MALIPYPDIDTVADDAQKILRTFSPNVVKMLAGSGTLFKPLVGMATAIVNESAIAPTSRELLALRVAHQRGSAYVLDQHRIMAPMAGVTEAQMGAIAGSLPSPHFSEADNCALLLVDRLAACTSPSEELVLAAYRRLGALALQQILIITLFYIMIAEYTGSLHVDLDAAESGDVLAQIRALGP